MLNRSTSLGSNYVPCSIRTEKTNISILPCRYWRIKGLAKLKIHLQFGFSTTIKRNRPQAQHLDPSRIRTESLTMLGTVHVAELVDLKLGPDLLFRHPFSEWKKCFVDEFTFPALEVGSEISISEISSALLSSILHSSGIARRHRDKADPTVSDN